MKKFENISEGREIEENPTKSTKIEKFKKRARKKLRGKIVTKAKFSEEKRRAFEWRMARGPIFGCCCPHFLSLYISLSLSLKRLNTKLSVKKIESVWFEAFVAIVSAFLHKN